MFYEKLEKLCKDQGISMNRFASDIGLSSAAVTGWKSGAIPRNNTLRKIADYFGITVNELMNDDEIIRPYVDRYYRSAAEDGLLFHDEHGRRLTTNRVRDLQADALRQVPSVRQLTPHECRHTFATLLKRTTGSKEDKKRLIGHSSDEMLEHYTHSEIAELRSIIDQF